VSTFVEVLIENSAVEAEQEIYGRIEAQFEEWQPAESSLEVWLAKAFARISSIVRGQAAETSASAFRKFGETIVNVPPILASPATVGSTWKMVNTAGYTITAGTKVNIASSGESVVAFEVVEDVVIAPGSDETSAGQVILRAIEPGTGGNGLSADPTPNGDANPATSATESITLSGVSSGGVQEETEDAYLDRLTEELQLLSLSLIVPEDFAKDARSVAGIARAVCLGGYENETANKPLDVTVFATDSAGAALSTPIKEALQSRQQAKVPSGVEVFVHDPKYTEVDVTAEVVAKPGFEPAVVKASVEARLAEYFSPANWGVAGSGEGESGPGAWLNATHVYIDEVISELDRVAGVQRVVLAKIRKHATGTIEAKDMTLEGVVPLTEVGTLSITAVSA
jgi:hypothetical protein